MGLGTKGSASTVGNGARHRSRHFRNEFHSFISTFLSCQRLRCSLISKFLESAVKYCDRLRQNDRLHYIAVRSP
ncbi:unnamed protein product [Cylicocyclus nassatus]|uniref:Uncharacterized protein n=1 Tax=Cylicocyclus nassatus TaxID=53992 RepID=A0AA36DNP4_CYLNA|nr:unnamed protein product [Cylicocyclus nassatus]